MSRPKSQGHARSISNISQISINSVEEIGNEHTTSHEGYVFHTATRKRKWKKSYAKLCGRLLYFYETEESERPFSQIRFSDYPICVLDPNKDPHMIHEDFYGTHIMLCSSSDFNSQFNLAAPLKSDTWKWMLNINEAIVSKDVGPQIKRTLMSSSSHDDFRTLYGDVKSDGSRSKVINSLKDIVKLSSSSSSTSIVKVHTDTYDTTEALEEEDKEERRPNSHNNNSNNNNSNNNSSNNSNINSSINSKLKSINSNSTNNLIINGNNTFHSSDNNPSFDFQSRPVSVGSIGVKVYDEANQDNFTNAYGFDEKSSDNGDERNSEGSGLRVRFEDDGEDEDENDGKNKDEENDEQADEHLSGREEEVINMENVDRTEKVIFKEGKVTLFGKMSLLNPSHTVPKHRFGVFKWPYLILYKDDSCGKTEEWFDITAYQTIKKVDCLKVYKDVRKNNTYILEMGAKAATEKALILQITNEPQGPVWEDLLLTCIKNSLNMKIRTKCTFSSPLLFHFVKSKINSDHQVEALDTQYGPLKKRGGEHGSFQLRYVAVFQKTLFFYKGINSEFPQGIICLDFYDKVTANHTSLTFSLSNSTNSKREYLFQAHDRNTLASWVTCFNANITNDGK